MLIREVVDPQVQSIENQQAALRKRKKQISADKARQRAKDAEARAKKSRQSAILAQNAVQHG